jgi:hypothetical protein
VLNRKFAIIYAGFVELSLVANYPGRTNADTLVMLWQAHNVSALDAWNAPFCSFFYGLLGPVFGYPFGGLILQSLVMLAWPAQVMSSLISSSSVRPSARVICIVLWTLVSCCFIALAGELIKDMIFCSFLSLAFFVCGSVESDESLLQIGGGRAVALVAAIVAMAVIRPSNIVLVAITGVALIVWGRGAGLATSRILSAAALTLCLSLVATAGQNALFSASPGSSYLPTVVHDIAGISANQHQDYFAELSGGQPDPANIARCYSPKEAAPLIWGDCKKIAESLLPLGASVLGKWLGLVVSHPGAYLMHRARFAAHVLIADNTGTKNIVAVPPLYLTAMNNAGGLAWLRRPELADHLQLWNPTIAYAPFGNIAGLLVGEGWLKQPLIWCCICMIGLAWSIYRKPTGKMMSLYLLAVIGLANVMTIVWIAPSDDLRYLGPTWMCALGSIAITCKDILQRGSAP